MDQTTNSESTDLNFHFWSKTIFLVQNFVRIEDSKVVLFRFSEFQFGHPYQISTLSKMYFCPGYQILSYIKL
jgi:hypothetical protein